VEKLVQIVDLKMKELWVLLQYERALGITPISGNASNDNGRGGDASSWGKYISAPDLARENLKVLCLNCNQIREPESKPREDSPKPKEYSSKPKKSKYFPR